MVSMQLYIFLYIRFFHVILEKSTANTPTTSGKSVKDTVERIHSENLTILKSLHEQQEITNGLLEKILQTQEKQLAATNNLSDAINSLVDSLT